jgi:nitroimidazol reductase NimA-like FMN-containing flavoprotein (pyridoxamine 5'-phosphate oxidase superfamily)
MITDRDEIDAIILGSEVCRVAMARENSPYMVPMSFGYDGDAIYLHTPRVGKKIEYFETNDKVCFEFERNVRLVPNIENACDSTFAYETVIGFGTISELLETDKKEHGLQEVVQQYLGGRPEMDEKFVAAVRVWKISIESMTAKRSPKEEAAK